MFVFPARANGIVNVVDTPRPIRSKVKTHSYARRGYGLN